MELQDELIQPCFVCGKKWTRKETDHYHYFQGIVVCQIHKGAKQWYKGALKLAELKLESVVNA